MTNDYESLAEGMDQANDDASYYQAKVQRLTKELDAVYDEVKRLYSHIDQGSEGMMVSMAANINSMFTAAYALQYYDIRWFAAQNRSPLVLQRFAQILIRSVSEYIKFRNFWYEIARGEFEALKLVEDDEENREAKTALPKTKLGDDFIKDDTIFGDEEATPQGE